MPLLTKLRFLKTSLLPILLISCQVTSLSAAPNDASSAPESPSMVTTPDSGAAQPKPKKAKAKPAAKTSASQANSKPPVTPTPAPGQNPPEVTQTMSPIIVEGATRYPATLDQIAASATVVTHEDLEEHQYPSVVEALNQIPGLDVVQSGTPGQETSIFTRGLESNYTLITIDGRRQAPGLTGADDNLTNLTLDDVDRIEDVRTPTATVSGGNTIGGVINIVTQSGKGLATPESSVYFEGGSYDDFREGIQSRGAVSNFDYSIGASNEDSEFERANSEYRDTAYRGNYGYQIATDLYFDLHTSYQNAYAGSPNSIFYPDPTAHILIEDWYLSPGLTWKATDFYTSTIYYTRDQQRQVAQNFDISGYTLDTRQQINTDLFDWQNNFQVAHNWQIAAGIQGDNQHVTLFDNPSDTYTVDTNLFTIGGYVESQWQPIEGMNVLNSVRYDAYSAYAGSASWRQAVSYKVLPTNTLLHVSGSSSYSPPSAQDLYYPGSSNPNLKPEKSLGWEFGVEQPLLKDRLTLSATYFHNHLSNFIQPDANYIPQNIPQAMTEGVEIGMKVRFNDQLTLSSNYTYTDAVNTTDQIRLIRRPRQMFNADMVWTPITPLTFTLGGNWALDRQDETFNPVTFAPENIDLPNYATLRASGTWKIKPWVEIWARGENILNEKYQPVLGYPALGATGYAGVRFKF